MSVARGLPGSYRFGLASSAAAQVAAAKATVAGSVSESAPVIAIKISEPALDLTSSRISKTSAVNSPAIAYSAAPITVSDRPSPPAPIPGAPPLSGAKALVIGASIGLIFLLGKLGKK